VIDEREHLGLPCGHPERDEVRGDEVLSTASGYGGAGIAEKSANTVDGEIAVVGFI